MASVASLPSPPPDFLFEYVDRGAANAMPAKVRRVMGAMQKMVKLDITALQAAFEGKAG